MNRPYNFNAGPAMLPPEVLCELRDKFPEFGGASILEISHRSKEFKRIIDTARSLVRELLNVPDDYHILFLQGGASLQFAMVPLNLMDKCADYSITGRWSQRAYAEAQVYGDARVAFTSEPAGFSRTPRPAELRPHKDASYLHITSNNTVYGTQYHEFPDVGDIPIVADMTSDVMTRRIDVSRFGLIYASAQKNLGVAGLTIVIIRKDLAGRKPRMAPTILSYRAHAEAGSILNTPPVFAIYVAMLILEWIKKMGGIAHFENESREKATLLYEVLDTSKLYRAKVEKESRSLTNITFFLPSEEMTAGFIASAKKEGLIGLAGHRSVGGIRASVYNAMPIEGVVALADFMRRFEERC